MKSNEVNNDVYSTVVLCALSYCVGLFGWNTGINGFFILGVLPIIWILCKSRLSVFFVMFSYYLGACDQLFYGADIYFADERLSNFLIWILHQMILACGWVIFWKRNMHDFGNIILRLTLTYLLTVFIPPFSLLGVAHPLTASGFYFPGMGFLGILFFTYFSVLFAYCFLKIKRKLFNQVPRQLLTQMTLLIIIITFMFMAVLDSDARLQSIEQTEGNKQIVSVNTKMGNIKADTSFIRDYQRHLSLKEITERKINDGYRVIILPEMIAGQWSKVEKELWSDVDKYAKEHKAVILLGAQNVISTRKYDNALIVLGDKSIVSKELLKARVSMPFSNWNPFLDWSATLNISRDNNGIIVIANKPTAVLICYEQMLVWPILQSMTSSLKPQLIITVSNLWWTKDTKILQIMENTTLLWGRLFNVPVRRAVNT